MKQTFSHLANRFIKDPSDAVKVGDVVKVKVLAVDAVRKRSWEQAGFRVTPQKKK